MTLNLNLDYSCISVLYTLSVALGADFLVQVKKNWQEMACFFIGIIGNAGINKSAPLSIFTRPLEKLDKKLFDQYKSAYTDFLKNRKKSEETNSFLEPIRRQILVKDITQEGLMWGLSQNTHGFGGLYDELGSFIRNFNKYSKNGGDEEMMLTLFSGKSLSVTRRSNLPLFIERPFYSVIGSIQPNVLVELFAQRVKNGMTHRFLWAYPPSTRREPLSEEEIPDHVMEMYDNIIGKIIKDEFVDGSPRKPTILSFSREAFEAYKVFRSMIDDKINTERSDDIKGIYAKLDTYCIRIALIIHISHVACGETCYSEYEIGKVSVEKARLAISYFEQTALKVFALLDRMRDPLVEYAQEYKIFYYQLPEQFTTDMAWTVSNERFGRRTLFNLLNDDYLFSKVKHGTYKKNW